MRFARIRRDAECGVFHEKNGAGFISSPNYQSLILFPVFRGVSVSCVSADNHADDKQYDSGREEHGGQPVGKLADLMIKKYGTAAENKRENNEEIHCFTSFLIKRILKA